MTTTIIIMGILLFILTIFSVNCQYINRKLNERYIETSEELYCAKQDLENLYLLRPDWEVHCDGYYTYVAHINKMGHFIYLWKERVVPGDDEHNDYIRRCAEEVCDKLNERWGK